MLLNERAKTLLKLFKVMTDAFDKVTDELKSQECSEPEKAAMQSQIFAALINEYVASLPGMTPNYVKQLVDYVFKCREEYLGELHAEELPTINAPVPKGMN